MRSRLLWCLLTVSFVVSTARASDGTLDWAYQSTGFQAGGSPQTVLGMGDGQTWPVIFSQDNSSFVQAYSLYPVINPQTQTYWQQIGSNLLYNPGNGILSAASSSDAASAPSCKAPIIT